MLAEGKLSLQELSSRLELDLRETQTLTGALVKKGLVARPSDELSDPLHITNYGLGVMDAHDTMC